MNAEIKDIRRGNIREMLAWVRMLYGCMCVCFFFFF
jgi:hypothetical protein